VAKANLVEAQSALSVAERELMRAEALREQGVISASSFDVTRADHEAKKARVAVAAAQVERAGATLGAARIRLGQTDIIARWEGGPESCVVAERFVDGGDVVSAGAPILRMVALDPVVGVVFVTERDYGYLAVDQPVEVTTDAHAGAVFPGRIARIAPVFAPGSRQARVEIGIPNADARLKPGMFIAAAITLRVEPNATVVPESALVTRNDVLGVFVVDAQGERVQWRKVEAGIRDDGAAQVRGEGLVGRVVVVGHQLVEDGSRITIPDPAAGPPNADALDPNALAPNSVSP
jgi:RND family efflux transporter MFP subunit